MPWSPNMHFLHHAYLTWYVHLYMPRPCSGLQQLLLLAALGRPSKGISLLMRKWNQGRAILRSRSGTWKSNVTLVCKPSALTTLQSTQHSSAGMTNQHIITLLSVLKESFSQRYRGCFFLYGLIAWNLPGTLYMFNESINQSTPQKRPTVKDYSHVLESRRHRSILALKECLYSFVPDSSEYLLSTFCVPGILLKERKWI